MPLSKKNAGKKILSRVKKDTAKSRKGEGKVGDKGNGNEAVTAMVRPKKKREGKNGGPGIVSSMSDHRARTPYDHLINVKISKWEEIGVIISTYDSYADITSKIQLRARELRMSMPSNLELLARVQSGCMFKKIVECREFVIVSQVGGYTKYQLRTLLNLDKIFAPRPLLNDTCMKKPSVAHKCELPTGEE